MKRLLVAAFIAGLPGLLFAQAPARTAVPALAGTSGTRRVACGTFRSSGTNSAGQAVLRRLPQRSRQGRRSCRWPSFDARTPPMPSTSSTTEKMIRKLRAGMMPPAGAQAARSPTARRRWPTALETRDRSRRARQPAIPAARPFQRLNRAEYARAVKDLLGARRRRHRRSCRADTISDGFDNVADAQAFSPTLMEGYLRAASKVTALAVGDPDAAATEAQLPRAEDRVADAARRRRAVRHARRHLGRAHLPGRRRLRLPASSCTATPAASSSAARRPASRSRFRSTASAWRCSTSTRAWPKTTDRAVAEDAADSRHAPARIA